MATRHLPSARFALCMLAGLWLSTAGGQTGSESESPEPQSAPARTASNQTDGEVSLEFLEFLGEWETSTGEWVDPTEFDTDGDSMIDDEVSETQ